MRRRYCPEFPRGIDEATDRKIRQQERKDEEMRQRRILAEQLELPFNDLPQLELCDACFGRGCFHCQNKGVVEKCQPGGERKESPPD